MLTTGEVAKLFQVSAQTIINWLDQGRMPFERIGRGPRRLTEETILKYIKDTGISPSALEQTIYIKALKKVYSSDTFIDDAVTIVNSDMVIIGWNEGVKALTGLTPMDALGKNITTMFNGVQGSGDTVERMLKGPWSNNAIHVSVAHKTKNKESINLNLTFSKYYSKGNIAGYAVVYHRGEEKTPEKFPGPELQTARDGENIPVKV